MLVTVLGACGGGELPASTPPRAGDHDQAPATCRVRLGPLPALPAVAPEGPEAASSAPPDPAGPRARLLALSSRETSRVIVSVEAPFATVAKELEAGVPKRVAEEHGRDIGIAGTLDLVVDRGAFTLSLEGETLVVRTPLVAEARACASGKGCYATCRPEAVAETRVSLRLRPDASFAQPHVSVALRRGCRVSMLGGIVSIDVTPMLEERIRERVPQVERMVASKLPDVRREVRRLYEELETPRALPLGKGCATFSPGVLAQGPIAPAPGGLALRFALELRPELRFGATCPDVGSRREPPVVPPLASEPNMPEEDTLLVAQVVPLSRVAETLGGASFESGSGPAKLDAAELRGLPWTASRVAGVSARVRFVGEACGEADVLGELGYSPDSTGIAWVAESSAPGEKERFAAGGLDVDRLVAAVKTSEPYRLPFTHERLAALVAQAPELFSDPRAETRVLMGSSGTVGVAVRGADVRATSKMRGHATIRVR